MVASMSYVYLRCVCPTSVGMSSQLALNENATICWSPHCSAWICLVTLRQSVLPVLKRPLSSAGSDLVRSVDG